MADHPLHQNMALQATHPHTGPLDLDDLDTITRTLDSVQDKISICPTRKLSIWRAVLEERYVPRPVNSDTIPVTTPVNSDTIPVTTPVNSDTTPVNSDTCLLYTSDAADER